ARLRSLRPVRAAWGALVVLAFAARTLAAQASTVAEQIQADRALLAKEVYVTPPAEIAKLVAAPRYRNVTLTVQSPDRTHFLRQESDGMPSVQEFGRFHYYFGGLQVDPAANRARALTTRASSGLSLIDAATGRTTAVEVPKGATVSSPAWSPDSRQVAYIANFPDASYAYVADAATGKSVAAARVPLLATLVTTIDWTQDGQHVVAVIVPSPRAPEPKKPAIETGPLVRLWLDGVKSPQRNFASLLDEPFDKELMQYYVTGQLALINVKTHAVARIGAPAMLTSVDASPDGRYFRVTMMQRPFSYVVQYSSFGTKEELWDAAGKTVAELWDRPLREGPDSTQAGAGFGGRGGANGPPGKKFLAWMPSGPGMYYVEPVPSADSAANGGGRANGRGGRGGRGSAARAERVVEWMPPYGKTDTKVLYTNEAAIGQLAMSDDAKTLFIGQSAAGQGEIVAVDLANPAERHVIVRQRDYTPAFGAGRGRGFGGGGRGGPSDEAFYDNPGAMLTRRGAAGGEVAVVSPDGGVFLQGVQYARDYLQTPPRAFVDKYAIATGQKTRVFEGPADAWETVVAPLDDDFSRAVITRETKTQVQDAYLWTQAGGPLRKLTDNTDYGPEFTNAVRKRIEVTRADGFRFVVNLTLPQGYREGTRLPGMFWFYPYEYTSQAEYDRTLRTENVNQFPAAAPRTIEYLVTQGYAVANFDPPIVGDSGRMNDNYVSDLVMDLSAVIDALDRGGYVDRSRLGIGGHSYGAFSTMNALAHTPFFKAGIAGDGMYNRSLTPDGFQNERRTFWTGQKTYEDMSPFFYADKIQGAILMYHSIEDQNVGTDPISSIRMMQALRGLGKTAALYMYPYEDHGPLTQETILDQWARWTAWLDMYVKHAGEWKAGAKDQISVVSSPSPF
ncbi:MAG: S9 family peptidase, partial [Gemmatimonadota bacterium]|nr:S9 family peptidase [Gemmatimonadota bacterium]